MNSTPQALQLPSAHPERPVHFTHRVSRPRTCKPTPLLGLRRLQRGQPRKLGSFDLSRLNHRHAFNPGPRSNEFDPTEEQPRWPLITCISGPLWRADWR